MKRQYRIKEHLGRFTIEVQKKESIKSGPWWNRRTTEVIKWTRSDLYGQPVYWARRIGGWLRRPCKKFKSLDEAKQQVALFQNAPKYYNPDGEEW